MWLRLLMVMLLAFILMGCASAGKARKDTEIAQLEAQLAGLKTQLQQKEEEVDILQGKLYNSRDISATAAKKGKARETLSTTVPMTPQNIQIALKRAGFYNGSLDGKIGKATKKSIKEFQKNNGLVADGIVGRQTWLKLNKYLQ